jgi:hypothetical protein
VSVYARISTKDHTGKRSTVLLEILSESDTAIFGQQVDNHGVKVGKWDEEQQAWVETQWLIFTETVTKRVPMEQDLHYGGLKEQ